MIKTIHLLEVFNKQIITRNSMSRFLQEILKFPDKQIRLDFSGVEFISRSCADEYVKTKMATKKDILEVNLSDQVFSMFKLASNQHLKNMGLSA